MGELSFAALRVAGESVSLWPLSEPVLPVGCYTRILRREVLNSAVPLSSYARLDIGWGWG